MEDFDREIKEGFLEESTTLLEHAEQAFLNLEKDYGNDALINEIFRLAHNLKGTSRAVGFGDVAEFTHEMENLILKIKQGEIKINKNVVSVLLQCNDCLVNMISKLRNNMEETFNNQTLIEVIKAVIVNPEAAAAPVTKEPASTLIDFSKFSDDKTDHSSVPNSNSEKFLDISDFANDANFNQASSLEDKVSNNDSGVLNFHIPEEVKSEKPQPKKEVVKEKKDIDETLRVSLSKIEKLNNFVGELVILQTVLEQRRFTNIKDDLSNKSIGQLTKLSKEIQDISMGLRMLPIKSTLQKMTRIVRDTSTALKKEVNLGIFGEETGVDKTVLEQLADPLVHIVRNAVDHGIETPEERVAAGKSPEGNIEIHALHEGNNLVIEVIDDGKGMDPNRLRQKAIEKGVIRSGEDVSDEEAINLIFHPGFSTKDQVTEVSGRGVGMDVVKTNIEKMSGTVVIESAYGVGSRIKVSLPLTLAIIDGMVVRLGDEKYIIQISQIQESLRPTKDIIHHVSGLGECMKLRDEVIPIVKLSKALKRDVKELPMNNQIAIVVATDKSKFAVLVDDILNKQQVVIKKLGTEIKNNKGFMGSSILGDGRPSVIIDLYELFSDINTHKITSEIYNAA